MSIFAQHEEFSTSNCLHSSTDRTSGYGLEDVGSNPAGDTKRRVKQSGCCHRLLSEWFGKMDGFRVFCSPQKIIKF